MEQGLTTSGLCTRHGLSFRTFRYWRQIGVLVVEPLKGGAGQNEAVWGRDASAEIVRTLRLQELGVDNAVISQINKNRATGEIPSHPLADLLIKHWPVV